MFINCLMVGLGGFCGSIGRYLLGLLPLWQGSSFPFGTLVTNVLGGLLIGVILGLSGRGLSMESELFWRVGLCGGFTTFSTFSAETLRLLESGQWGWGLLYSLLSILCCLVAVYAGRMLVAA